VDVDVSVEDPGGRRLAGSAASHAEPVLYREVVADQRVIARIVARGAGTSSTAFEASLEALAMAIGALVDPGPSSSDRRLDLELAHGRRLQRSFVALVAPEVPGYEVASHYEAAREVGGDFFDLFRRRRRRRPLSIVIADVTGKGIAAALLMAFSRPLLHAAIDNTKGPVEALERTNTILVQERRSSLFITAVCAELDLPTGVLRVANAGHEPPLLVPASVAAPIRAIDCSGAMLGAFRSIGVVEGEVTMGPGDAVVFYTDGVTDAANPSGERFGIDRLHDALLDARARGSGAGAIVDAIRAAMDAFQGDADPADDVTVVVLSRR
jgi:serine phosphatase RsbU (regulator of sigma subunit)